MRPARDLPNCAQPRTRLPGASAAPPRCAVASPRCYPAGPGDTEDAVRHIARLSRPGTIRGCAPGQSRHRQQGSRIVSPLFAALRLLSSMCSHGGHPYLYRPWSGRPRLWWSRPARNDVRSMFARMSRYAPAARGIRSPLRIQATAQNGRPGSYRHRSTPVQGKNRTEERTLNPRVRDSSPWRRTRDDLGVLSLQVIFVTRRTPAPWRRARRRRR